MDKRVDDGNCRNGNSDCNFVRGHEPDRTGKTAIIQTFEPVASIVAGVIFLSEPLTIPRVIGATFVISAVGVLATVESRSATRIIHQ